MKTKLLIPVILATVMMIGATFAVAPVEKASTVHTTIIAALTSVGSSATFRSANATGGATEKVFSMFIPYNGTNTIVQILPTKTGSYSGFASVISSGAGTATGGCALSGVQTTTPFTTPTGAFVSAKGVSTALGNTTLPAGVAKIFYIANATNIAGSGIHGAPGCTITLDIKIPAT